MSDLRMTFTKEYIVLRQNSTRCGTQKIPSSIAIRGRYILNGNVFIKRTDADPTKAYPVFGRSCEMFSQRRVLGTRDTRFCDEGPTGTEREFIEEWAYFEMQAFVN